jgi:hypothetical protein
MPKLGPPGFVRRARHDARPYRDPCRPTDEYRIRNWVDSKSLLVPPDQ